MSDSDSSSSSSSTASTSSQNDTLPVVSSQRQSIPLPHSSPVSGRVSPVGFFGEGSPNAGLIRGHMVGGVFVPAIIGSDHVRPSTVEPDSEMKDEVKDEMKDGNY